MVGRGCKINCVSGVSCFCIMSRSFWCCVLFLCFISGVERIASTALAKTKFVVLWRPIGGQHSLHRTRRLRLTLVFDPSVFLWSVGFGSWSIVFLWVCRLCFGQSFFCWSVSLVLIIRFCFKDTQLILVIFLRSIGIVLVYGLWFSFSLLALLSRSVLVLLVGFVSGSRYGLSRSISRQCLSRSMGRSAIFLF